VAPMQPTVNSMQQARSRPRYVDKKRRLLDKAVKQNIILACAGPLGLQLCTESSKPFISVLSLASARGCGIGILG
jgi:hypothetical protein